MLQKAVFKTDMISSVAIAKAIQFGRRNFLFNNQKSINNNNYMYLQYF